MPGIRPRVGAGPFCGRLPGCRKRGRRPGHPPGGGLDPDRLDPHPAGGRPAPPGRRPSSDAGLADRRSGQGPPPAGSPGTVRVRSRTHRLAPPPKRPGLRRRRAGRAAAAPGGAANRDRGPGPDPVSQPGGSLQPAGRGPGPAADGLGGPGGSPGSRADGVRRRLLGRRDGAWFRPGLGGLDHHRPGRLPPDGRKRAAPGPPGGRPHRMAPVLADRERPGRATLGTSARVAAHGPEPRDGGPTGRVGGPGSTSCHPAVADGPEGGRGILPQ